MSPLARSVIAKAIEIRAFEQFLLESFQLGLLRGTTHTCLGQELTPTVIGNIKHEGSFLISNHRNHGFFLGTGGLARDLLREIVGKSNGVSRGIGGSQHIHSENFISHGILGGLVPFAVGKGVGRSMLRRSESPIILHIGDGTFGEGIVYESLNLAMVYKSSIVIVVENNEISQSTVTKSVISGNLYNRCRAIVPNTTQVSDQNYPALVEHLAGAMSHVSSFHTPSLVIVNTKRLGPHSKGRIDLDPWMGEDDPVFKASGVKTRMEFRRSSIEIYKTMYQLFREELGSGLFFGEFNEDWCQKI